MRKCQPGMICFENVTIAFILILILVIGYFVYVRTDNSRDRTQQQPTTNYILQCETIEIQFSGVTFTRCICSHLFYYL